MGDMDTPNAIDVQSWELFRYNNHNARMNLMEG